MRRMRDVHLSITCKHVWACVCVRVYVSVCKHNICLSGGVASFEIFAS